MTITTHNRTLLFVEVPDNSEMGHVNNDTCKLWYTVNGLSRSTKLPSGNYRFIATTDTINLVDKIDILGGGVFHSNSDWDSYFQAFLEIHSITGRHAIIEVL